MIHMTLSHDGTVWKATNGQFSASGKTLIQLDREIARFLRDDSRYQHCRQIPVFMSYDNSLIPEWIRQYSGHYFNRTVTIDLSHTPGC